MTFQEALQKLGIEKYADRIFNSNSHGELLHLQQYFILAQIEGDMSWFPKWFESTVRWAEVNWTRPESVFQHIDQLLIEMTSRSERGGGV